MTLLAKGDTEIVMPLAISGMRKETDSFFRVALLQKSQAEQPVNGGRARNVAQLIERLLRVTFVEQNAGQVKMSGGEFSD